jgi:clan AA aspartic protease (TIGR02281 family)
MRIPFEKQGTLMRVNVRLNDSVTAPFLVDTGASHISVPYWVIERLGVAITDSTPRRTAMTANGLVSEPIVNLSAVQLGPARVNNLDASVSGSMQIGLLGGSFFNNFIYQVDAAASVIILSPNDRVVSGLTEEQWRERFNGIREPLARLEAVLERGGFVDKQRVRQLEARRADLRAKLADLDALATRSEVPQRWRH